MTQAPATHAYLSPPAIAERLGVSPEKVIRWIARGELRAVNLADRLGGRPRWRVSQADLESFLAARAAQPRPGRRRPRTESYPRYV